MLGWIILFLLIVIVFGTMFLTVFLIIGVFVNRHDRRLRAEAEAHRRILEGTYDHLWDTCKEMAGVPERFRTSFTDIYPNIINANIDNDMLLNWLLDCNPDFDPELYPQLLDVIDADRERFVLHQNRMLAIIEQHRNLVTSWLTSKLVRNRAAIVYVPIDTRYDRWGKRL